MRALLPRLAVALAAAAGAGVFACGGSSPADPADAGPGSGADAGLDGGTCQEPPLVGDLPLDVNAVLEARCQPCHTSPPQNNAPFPLLSYEDTQQRFGITSKRIWQRMAEVTAPGGSPQMPKAPYTLTDAERATLQAWFAGCAQPIAEGSGHDLLRDGGTEH